VSSTATGTPYVTPAAAAYAGGDTGAAPAMPPGPPPGPSPDWRPPSAVGPVTSPVAATGLTARLPAAVTGKRGRLLLGTGAVVVALAVGAGILLGTRKSEPDPSLTGVQSPIPTFAPAPLPVPVPAVVPEITSATLTPTTTPPAPPTKATTKRTRAATAPTHTAMSGVPGLGRISVPGRGGGGLKRSDFVM